MVPLKSRLHGDRCAGRPADPPDTYMATPLGCEEDRIAKWGPMRVAVVGLMEGNARPLLSRRGRGAARAGTDQQRNEIAISDASRVPVDEDGLAGPEHIADE